MEAEIGKEDGRTVYEVEIIDASKQTHKVFVDAETGTAKIDKTSFPVLCLISCRRNRRTFGEPSRTRSLSYRLVPYL